MSEFNKNINENAENEAEKKKKAWFEKDCDEWDENDEFEAFCNLFLSERARKEKNK